MTDVISAPGTSVSEPRTPTVDWGRTLMVPLSLLIGSAGVAETLTLVASGSGSTSRAAAIITSVQTTAFYALIVWAYLRRGPASATSRVPLALVAAPVATFLPFVLPYLGTGGVVGSLLLAGNVLLVAGLGWSLWAIRCLDRSLSVLPQARHLVDHGPYAWVRHPLYLGELVAMLGLALSLGGPGPLVAWAALCVLQAYRSVHEERLLGGVLPGYEAYRSRTARILPGVF